MREKSPSKEVSFVSAGSTIEHLQDTVVVLVRFVSLEAGVEEEVPSTTFVTWHPSVTHPARSLDHHEHQNSCTTPPASSPVMVLDVWVVLIPHASVFW